MLLPMLVKAQFCSTATLVNMGVITPTTTWQNVTGAASAKRYWTFNATAGCTYDFSTCNSLFTNDTYLRLYSGTNPLTATFITSNDDDGPFCLGLKASFTWTCGTSGTYSILLTNYVCANLSASTILRYRETCSTLPIELMWFDGWRVESNIRLQWATESETNNDYFIVEKYDTASNEWLTVSTIDGNGTTSIPHFYETADYSPSFGYNYYRLKQVDYDGQSETFAPISVYKPYINRKVKSYVNPLGQEIIDLNVYSGLYLTIYEDGYIEKRVK